MAIYHLHVSTGSKSAGASGAIRHDYLTRQGDYQDRADELVYSVSENLPSWAQDAREFWSAADAHERANGRLYQEVEFALPRELDQEQQIELAKGFAQDLTHAHKLPYTLAIHSDGKNPHAHLVYSERAGDGIERSKELHFRRANSASPELGGAPKVTSLRGSDWVKQVRQDWEISANASLERANSYTRIDCRSHQDRGLDQTPQIHLGVRAAAMMRQGISTERSQEWERREELRSLEREIYTLEGRREDLAYRYDVGAHLDPADYALERDIAAYEAQERKQFEHDMQEELRQEQAELDRELELERQREAQRLKAQQLEQQKAQQAERSNSPPERSQSAQPPSPLAQTIRKHMAQGGRIEELTPGVSVTGVRLEGTFYSPSKQQSYALVQDEKDPKRMVAVRADEPELGKSWCAEGKRMRISCLHNNVGRVCVTSMRKDQDRDRSWGR